MLNRNKKNPNLPIIIFMEAHSDPITAKTIYKIFPKLKAMGYNKFLDEAAKDINLSGNLQKLSFNLELTKKIATDMISVGLDFWNKEDLKRYAKVIFDNEEQQNQFISEAISFGERYKSRKTNKKLNLYLQNEGIEYIGTDMKSIAHENLYNDIKYLQKYLARDQSLAKQYLKHIDYGVVGNNGVAHTEGMQKYFIDQLSKEIALSKFCFFYIYTQAPDPFEKQVRAGEIEYPLGLIQINANNKTQAEIEEIILSEIARKSYILQTSNTPKISELSSNSNSKISNNNNSITSKLNLNSKLEKTKPSNVDSEPSSKKFAQ